ncbi:MAG TPA: CDP-alcohol phosphatidyltransferase family protein [Myxococcota bacterium]|jgi:hypothetical protein|nr:CDP-alcohol phosphatidyltransferase family protein [Myxococcota bacterium]
MFAASKRLYLDTRKKHDQLWNRYVVRPLAAPFVVALRPTPVTPNQVTFFNLGLFAVAAACLVALPGLGGGLVAVAVIELSYVFDCVDGMLARAKKLASPTGHLLDFLTDEIKAFLLVAGLAVRLWRQGGWGFDARGWGAGDVRFLLAGVAGLVVTATGIALTTFMRRPEYTGAATTTEAHYETAGAEPGVGSNDAGAGAGAGGGAGATTAGAPTSPVRRAAGLALVFLRFLNHYPSHIWIWAAVGRLDLFFWMYVSLQLLYCGKSMLSVLLKLGSPSAYAKRAASPGT